MKDELPLSYEKIRSTEKAKKLLTMLTDFLQAPQITLANDIYQTIYTICEARYDANLIIWILDLFKQSLKEQGDIRIRLVLKEPQRTKWTLFRKMRRQYMMYLQLLAKSLNYLDAFREHDPESSFDRLDALFVLSAIDEGLSIPELYKEAFAFRVCSTDYSDKEKNDCKEIFDMVCHYETVRQGLEKLWPPLDLHELVSYGRIFFPEYITKIEANEKNVDIFAILRVWDNAVDTVKYLGASESEKVRLIGLQEFEKRHDWFFRTIKTVKLTAESIYALYIAMKNVGKGTDFAVTFIRSRDINFRNEDFDELLNAIALIEHEMVTDKTKTYEKKFTEDLLKKVRLSFKESITNVEDFHKKLLKYYNQEIKLCSSLERENVSEKWIFQGLTVEWPDIFAVLLAKYVPKLSDFIDYHLKPLIFRRIVMFNDDFVFNYQKNPKGKEAALIDILTEMIPNDIWPVKHMIYTAIKDFQNPSFIGVNNQIPMFKLFIDKKIFKIESRERSHEPIWIDKTFKDAWTSERQSMLKESKQLEGAFRFNVIEMSSPIELDNGRGLTLIINFTTAAILNQFNDFETITVDSLEKKLNVTQDQYADFSVNLKKLIRYGLIKEKKGVLQFNQGFKPTAITQETGVLRVN
ncbi:hypothetical protein NCAS_0B07310 [Naumovozyma castellii]|uniref:Cullin family profile domain-containing protein n=1 Tax=Naumovozyma castellii TaxID=27288 RepID=G0VA85_NAUCA|nr:hypothetical protein NCAS_0B07310 [Naumovozyma castellii CBS 4309]CCC68815.1 hypothetical protein NCAS_0B07310 [Naumovozyma castellii CBS 4309]